MTKINFGKVLTGFDGEPVRLSTGETLSQKEQKGLTQEEIKERQTKGATIENMIYRLINNYSNPNMRESYLLNKIGEMAAEGEKCEVSDRQQGVIFDIVKQGVEDEIVHPRIAMQIIEELDEKYIERIMEDDE